MSNAKKISLKKKSLSDLDSVYIKRILFLILPPGLILVGLISVLLWTMLPGTDWYRVFVPLALITFFWMILVAMMMTRMMIRSLTRPIYHLAKVLRKIDPRKQEESSIPLPPEHMNNEFGQVILATNHMLRKIYESSLVERQNMQEIAAREAMLTQILNNMPDAVVCLDANYRILRLNNATAKLIGREEAGLIGADFTKLLAAGDQLRLTTRLTRLHNDISDEPVIDFDCALSMPNGPERSVNMTLSRLSREFAGYVITFREHSQTKGAQQQVKESEKRLQQALRASRCSVWEQNIPAGSFWWSPEFLPMLGYEADELQPSLENKMSIIHPEDVEWVKNTIDRYLAQQTSEFHAEYRVKRKDGSFIWVDEFASAEFDAAGVALKFSGALTDCTERKRFEKQMMYMATHDPLTDLPNRTLLNDRLQHALIGNQRMGLMVGVLLLDIDRFKLINESLGHEIGDQLIRSVAQRMQQNIRPTDTLARLSGDEFVVICEGLPTPQEAARVAKRLLSSMAQHFIVDGNNLTIGMSIGISVSPADGNTPQDILRNADTAMHSAKTSGGNCYRFFVADMNREAMNRLTIERRISEAIERSQFVLNYQPKVDMVTREVVGAEALIRWPQFRGATISPLQFIPVAEETGQILAIGEWVIRETLSQICLWRDRGLTPLPIAVNLSAKQLMSGGIDEQILRLLREYNVPPHLLEIEVTESSLMTHLDKVLPPLHHLREAGVGIALDDFGTGYSSLAYLRQMPFTTLKIDRSFVKDVPGKSEANSIASIILEIGREMKMKVVAEGIETEEQYEFLRERKCDMGQGWLFHKAYSGYKFQDFLKKKS